MTYSFESYTEETQSLLSQVKSYPPSLMLHFVVECWMHNTVFPTLTDYVIFVIFWPYRFSTNSKMWNLRRDIPSPMLLWLVLWHPTWVWDALLVMRTVGRFSKTCTIPSSRSGTDMILKHRSLLNLLTSYLLIVLHCRHTLYHINSLYRLCPKLPYLTWPHFHPTFDPEIQFRVGARWFSTSYS